MSLRVLHCALNPGAVELLRQLPANCSLRQLHYTVAPQDDDLSVVLCALTCLEDVTLDWDYKSAIPHYLGPAISNLPRLRSLRLGDDIGMRGPVLERILLRVRVLSSLRILHMDIYGVPEATCKELASMLSKCTGLEEFKLKNMPAPDIFLGFFIIHSNNTTAGILSSLGGLSSLRVLSLCEVRVLTQGMKTLSACSTALVHLRTLNLHFNPMGPRSVKDLASVLSVLSCVQEIDLTGNGFGNAGATTLAGSIGRLSTLQKLFLDMNGIQQDVMLALASELCNLPYINYWDLLRTIELTDESAVTLAPSLSKMTALQTLKLCGPQCTFSGVVALAEAMGNFVSLIHLDISSLKVSEVAFSKGLQSISKLSSLRCLNLSVFEVSQELRISLAHCVASLQELQKHYFEDGSDRSLRAAHCHVLFPYSTLKIHGARLTEPSDGSPSTQAQMDV